MKRSNVQVGDVFEVHTSAGLAYFQFSHVTPDDLDLIRILPGVFPTRPGNVAELAGERELYYTFYPVGLSAQAGDIERVCHCPVPNWAIDFPVMRKRGGIDREGNVLNWFISKASTPCTIEGYRSMRMVESLSKEENKLSIREMWSHLTLVKSLAEGWLPELEEELTRKRAEKVQGACAGLEHGRNESLDHYLYFGRKADAQAAARHLRSKGWFAEVRKGADGKNWLTTVKQPISNDYDMDSVRDELETLADELHGEYDGWGMSL